MLIDVAIPDDRNILMKEAEKIIKYKDLEIEITRMWNVRAKTVPVIVGALGTVKKEAEKNTDVIPGRPRLTEVQKIAIMGTAHILRKVLG